MFLIMLQVTGHAGGVPKAILERGRSVSFPFSGNHGYIRNLRRSLQSVDRVSFCVQKQLDKVKENGIEQIDVHLCKLIFYIFARHLKIWLYTDIQYIIIPTLHKQVTM